MVLPISSAYIGIFWSHDSPRYYCHFAWNTSFTPCTASRCARERLRDQVLGICLIVTKLRMMTNSHVLQTVATGGHRAGSAPVQQLQQHWRHLCSCQRGESAGSACPQNSCVPHQDQAWQTKGPGTHAHCVYSQILTPFQIGSFGSAHAATVLHCS